MKSFFRLRNVFFASLFTLTIGYGRCAAEGSVRILVNGIGPNDKQAKVSITNMLNGSLEDIAVAIPDKQGVADLKFDITKPVFGFLVVGGSYNPIFLSPASKIEVVMADESLRRKTKYSGDSKDINNYLINIDLARKRYSKLGDKYYFQLSSDQYKILRDSLQSACAELLSGLVAQGHLDSNMRDVLALKNRLKMLFFEQNYVVSNFGMNQNASGFPEPMKAVLRQIPFDSKIFEYGLGEYNLVASTFIRSNIYTPIYQKHKEEAFYQKRLPAYTDDEIRRGKYPKQLEEYMLAMNIDLLMVHGGLTPETDSLYTAFSSGNSNKEYLRTVKQRYDKWRSIGKGMKAPDFTGVDPDGKQISLSDLKGKVIYIDVWATWCGPCREEFPKSKKVIENFKDSNNIVFLFVSIDQNLAAWKKLVREGGVPSGTHINQKQDGQPGAIWESYLISGVPRYILIDADGLIVEADAERPSSEKLIAQLDDLLNRSSTIRK